MKYYCLAEYCVWRFREKNRFACMFPGEICPKGKCMDREEKEQLQRDTVKEDKQCI